MTNAAIRFISNIGASIVHAVHGTRRVGPIAYREVTSYADLLSARQPSILWLYEAKLPPPNEPLLFPELATAEIRTNHAYPGPTPMGIGIAHLTDVVVSGYSLVGTSMMIHQLGPPVPFYVDDQLARDVFENSPPVRGRKLARRIERRVPGVSVVITHWNSDVYGHWLIECMPKLLLLRRILDRLPAFRIVLPLATPAWLLAWIRLVLPEVAIEPYDQDVEYIRCEKLLLPTMLMEKYHYMHPQLVPFLDELAREQKSAKPAHARLYVTRVTQSLFRELTNRGEIEDIAVAEGLTLVCPETLSIAEQIVLFANARIIVGEFGSAMHTALFSPSGTRVLCLNWINGVQSRIAQVRRHRVGYLLASSGAPVVYSVDTPRSLYHVDPKVFRNCVRELVSESDRSYERRGVSA